MPTRDIIVVGASTGGVEAVSHLTHSLPADLPAAVFVVVHFPISSTSVLPTILNRRGPLKAAHARDGEPIEPGRIYVATPNCHLLVEAGRVRSVRGPAENGHRPAVDPLFRSAARVYGPRVVGVILSGFLDDGTAGLKAIKQRGGVAIAQDPEEALAPGMPRSAIENMAVDHVLPVEAIGGILSKIARETVHEAPEAPPDMDWEARNADLEWDAIQGEGRPGKQAEFACPSCGGALWELTDGDLLRFRCRVGHAFSVGSLLHEQSTGLEEAFWVALRSLEERASLARRLADRAHARGHDLTARRFESQVAEAEHRAEAIRRVLLSENSLDDGGDHMAPYI